MVICLERDANLHVSQLVILPLTVSCFSKMQIGFTFLVPAHLGSPGQRVVKRVLVLLLLFYFFYLVAYCFSVLILVVINEDDDELSMSKLLFLRCFVSHHNICS